MPTTYVDYTATAAQTDFAFTFPYLEDEHVTVEIDGSPISSSLFSLVTSPSTKIVLNSGATAGQIVRVRRKSQPGTDLVDFENGSVLTESELDRAYLHNRYLNEEIAELNDASLQKKQGSDNYTAKNNKIVDLADPTDPQDAATKNYVDTQDALQVTKTGDSMSGILAMGSNKITGLGAPTLTDDAATKTYVDAKVNQVSSGATSPPTKWVFTGTAGADTTYSVTGAEVNGDTAYDVSVDGSVLEPTTDYTVDPDTDTLTIVNTLSGGEDIVVIERGFGIAVSDGVVGADQLQSNAVTTAKLADHSVTAVKISNTDPIFNVQTTGEVGVGTTSPTAKLQIDTSDNTTIYDPTDGTPPTLGDYLLAIRNDYTGGNVLGTFAGIQFNVYGGSANQNAVAAINLVIEDNNTRKGALTFIPSSSTADRPEAMRIDSDGNVGIGTTVPDAKLEVENDTGSSLKLKSTGSFSSGHQPTIVLAGENLNGDIKNLARIRAISEGAELGALAVDVRKGAGEPHSEAMRIDSDGHVGIGTTSPSTSLDINKGLTESEPIITLSRGETPKGRVAIANGTSSVLDGSVTNDLCIRSEGHNIKFGTAEAIRTDMTIDSGGNVGIGTVSPSAPLEVASTTGGVVFPRLTTTQRDAISSPTNGETIFNSTTNVVESYNGTSWTATGGGVRAKCFFDGTSASPTASGATNIASITKNGTGDYTVNFTSSITDPVASVSVVNANTSNPVDASIHTISSSSVRILTGTNTGGLINFAGVHLLVF